MLGGCKKYRQMLPAPYEFQHASNLLLKMTKMPFQNDEKP